MNRLCARRLLPFALAASTLALTAGVSSAQPLQGSQLMDDLLACRALDSDAERFACLDRTSAALEAAIDAGSVTVVERERAQQAERDSFGSAVVGTGRFFSSLFDRGGASEGPQVETYDDGVEAVRAADGDIESLAQCAGTQYPR